MTKAQGEFIKNQVLSELGGYYDKVNPNSYPVLERILIKAGLEFNKRVVQNLTKLKAINTGGLTQLEPPVIKYFGNKYVLEIGYDITSPQAKYYDYVDKGVKGTKNEKASNSTKYKFKSSSKSIPVDVVKKWLTNKGSKSTSVGKYRKLGTERTKSLKQVSSTDAAAFLIARSIHRKGLRTTNYFSNAMKLVFDKGFKDALQVAIGADVNIKILQVFNQNFK